MNSDNSYQFRQNHNKIILICIAEFVYYDFTYDNEPFLAM